MAYDKRKMQDISISEKPLWFQYMEYLKNGDYSGANSLLQGNPSLKYKVLNSFNWNRLINLVNDGSKWNINPDGSIDTDSGTDCLVGTFASDYNQLIDVGKNARYVGYWAEGVDYKKNNLVKVDEHFSYFCISSHTSSSATKPPDSRYWILAVNVLSDEVGLPVLDSSPTSNILYFRILN
jgi:hypothetical protein